MSLSSYFWDCGLVDAAALAVAEVLCAQRWDGPLADLSCQDLVEAIRINQARHNDLTKVREELCSRAREQGSRESKDSGKHKIVPPPFHMYFSSTKLQPILFFASSFLGVLKTHCTGVPDQRGAYAADAVAWEQCLHKNKGRGDRHYTKC